VAEIAIIAGPIRSKLIISNELAARLRAAGHGVSLIAPPGDAVDAAGLDCLRSPLRLELPPAGASAAKDRASRVARCAAAVDAARVDEFRDLLGGLAPDLVLVDIEEHAHVIAAVTGGLRVALLNIFFNLWKQPGVPPVHLPITPGVGLAGSRSGIELAWARYRLWRWRALRRARRHGAGYEAQLEAFAARLGFPLGREVDYFQGLLPFIYRHLPMVNTNLLEFDLPHAPRPDCYYVGPMTSSDRAGFAFAQSERHAAATIDRVAAEARQASPPRKVIYCAFGAYFWGDDHEFWQRVVRAVTPHPEWTVILGLGGRVDPATLGALPGHVHALAWAPQMHALSRADCAVVHGGMTSVYECLQHEVPILSYPYREIFDQAGTAARVRYHGLGLVGDRRRDTPEVIAARIGQVLANDARRPALAAMRRHIDRARDEAHAARAIAALLGEARD